MLTTTFTPNYSSHSFGTNDGVRTSIYGRRKGIFGNLATVLLYHYCWMLGSSIYSNHVIAAFHWLEDVCTVSFSVISCPGTGDMIDSSFCSASTRPVAFKLTRVLPGSFNSRTHIECGDDGFCLWRFLSAECVLSKKRS
ncbi:hypothetical protein KSP40_PGU009125 [Platanthera guangdongensis]|uniref:Uncharacterized protein n=1 Tax=Platanthera guangdongensis TaxID=2320717 RepID=A0ABR2MRR5_9ASPA